MSRSSHQFSSFRRPALSVLLGSTVLVSAAVAQGSLASLAKKAEAQGYRTGVVVQELSTGRVVFQHRSDEMFLPASNQKLLTTAAALWGLGADYRFKTTFTLEAGVLRVHSGGDPNWSKGGPHDPAQVFGQVAARLRQAGVTSIRRVELLPGRFTGPIRPEGWPRDQFDRLYCAPTGGLILEAGTFLARISPSAGAQAQVEVLSPPVNAVFGSGIKMTSQRKTTYSYWLSQGERAGTSARFFGHGEIGTRVKPVEVRGVSQTPGWLFAESLKTVLRRSGIAIDPGAAARDADVLTWESGLEEALEPMLEDSSNFHAEQLFRVVGAELEEDGSFPGGSKAVRDVLSKRLELPPALVIADGSGLSRLNQVTPAFLVTLLRSLFRGEHTVLLATSLPQGGVEGTLSRRFRNSPVSRRVWAKTGTINGVKCLSGIVRLSAGEILVFSILMNRRNGTSTAGAADIQDQMVEAIYSRR